MTDRFGRPGVRPGDAALALLVVALVVLATPHIGGGRLSHDVLAYGCGVVGALSLAFWRRFATAMTVAAAAAVVVYNARGYPGGPTLLAGPVALLLLGYRERRSVAVCGAALMAIAVAGAHWAGVGRLDLTVLVTTGWSFAAALAGMVLAARGERAAAERERAGFRQRQAVADERLRIARDLHDSVAHAMATINVQSGVAAHLLAHGGSTEAAGNALEVIRAASSEVLDDLGVILTALRADHSAAPLAPVAGAARIGELVERARADGLAVRYTVDGELAMVPPSLGSAAFRVVQEALSNSRRHAGAAAAVEVRLSVVPGGRIAVEITDDGGRPPAAEAARGTIRAARQDSGGGLGLIGMRERVEALGGFLDAGPAPGAGYRVRATWQLA